jgi:hypothetical protein
MLTRSKVTGTLIALVLLVPAGVFLASNNVSLDLNIQDDPLEYVQVIDQGRPIAAEAADLLQRLKVKTGEHQGIDVYQDWDPASGGAPYSSNGEAQKRLSRSVHLPAPADYGVLGVATNTERTSPFGEFYLIWFNTPADAESWLTDDPSIFTDSKVEAARTSYWAGKFVVYYAPPGEGRDWSPEVRQAVEEFASS